MNRAVLYVYLQNELPYCFWSSLKKTREMWDGDIYLVAPKKESSYVLLKEYDVKFVASDFPADNCHGGLKDTDADAIVGEYDANTFLCDFYPLAGGFWDNACKRLIYLYLLQKEYSIDKIIHLETDVVPYMEIKKMFDACEGVYKDKIAFVPHTEEQVNCNFVYSGSIDSSKVFCDCIIEYFKKGVGYFSNRYEGCTAPNETHLVRAFCDDNKSVAGLLPALPEDPMFKELGFLVDPQAWGMWVGGIKQIPDVPYATDKHYVGEQILSGKYDVLYSVNINKRILPYVWDKTNNRVFPLAILHIHSKRLEKWI